jgi:uncharacterized membrane protein YphA (DoxX/SURF4 family)
MSAVSTKKLSLLLVGLAALCGPAEAHVKWFLDRPESEILARSKPDLFTQFSIWNALPILSAIFVTVAFFFLNKHFASSSFSRKLAVIAGKHEAEINLLMALCLGTSLIYCAMTRILLVPNFIICSHCPWYLPYIEAIIGIGLILGFCSRVCALALFGLLLYAIIKHGLADGLDLLPFYGLAAYFLLSGRNRLSLDYALSIDRNVGPSVIELSHLIVRVCMSLGLIILAFDEKLLHPQLALDLLKAVPWLNFLSSIGVNNDMFILCSGLTELALGVMLLLGIFPRLIMAAIAFLFVVTTSIFGIREFFGHALFYGIIFSVLLRGNGIKSPAAAIWNFFKERNGGLRPTVPRATRQSPKGEEKTDINISSSYGTLKHFLPARPSKSLLAKQQAYILSSKLAEDMQADSQVALAS